MRHAIFILIVLAVPVLAHAATLKVPSQYPTIQDAIDAASGGDTVLVEPGTYVENIDFKGKAITVTSEQGPNVTIIDGNQTWSVVTFDSGEGVNSVLDGFTVTNGGGPGLGGGINCEDSSPTITNTILWDNNAQTGPEIYVDSGNPTVTYSDVKGGWSGTGNIDSDPLFVEPNNDDFDFHLTWVSPCINRGTNDDAPSEDFDGDPRPYMGTVDMGADEFTGIHPLECDTFTLSETTGGILHVDIYGGIENAGRNYLIYGSISGTAPGTPLPGGLKTLPINWDMFTNIVADVNYPDSIIFKGFFGSLDPNGQMDAVFDTNGPVPGMAGYTVCFAYLLQGPPWDFVSNPVGIEIVP